jgi:hypothetical protein
LTLIFYYVTIQTVPNFKINQERRIAVESSDVKPGLRVKTTKLGDTEGMVIAPKHLSIRCEGVTGTVKSYVPGYGGDVWFVQHDDSNNVGAYVVTEIELV